MWLVADVMMLITFCVYTVRRVWKDFFPVADGIVFLLDVNDVQRFPEAKKELHVSC